MEFQKERVFTALNADELKIGSKIIAANNIDSLRCKVCDDCGYDYYIVEVKKILDESYERRFQLNYNGKYPYCKGAYPFVYLISEPEEKKLKWTDLKLGDVIRRKDGLREGTVTFIDKDIEKELHICCGSWLTDKDLEIWEKVE